MAKEYYEDFQNVLHVEFVKKPCEEGDAKVKYHDITNESSGTVDQVILFQLKIIWKIIILILSFHEKR